MLHIRGNPLTLPAAHRRQPCHLMLRATRPPVATPVSRPPPAYRLLKRSLNAKCKMQRIRRVLHFSLCIFHSGCPFSSPCCRPPPTARHHFHRVRIFSRSKSATPSSTSN